MYTPVIEFNFTYATWEKCNTCPCFGRILQIDVEALNRIIGCSQIICAILKSIKPLRKLKKVQVFWDTPLWDTDYESTVATKKSIFVCSNLDFVNLLDIKKAIPRILHTRRNASSRAHKNSFPSKRKPLVVFCKGLSLAWNGGLETFADMESLCPLKAGRGLFKEILNTTANLIMVYGIIYSICNSVLLPLALLVIGIISRHLHIMALCWLQKNSDAT